MTTLALPDTTGLTAPELTAGWDNRRYLSRRRQWTDRSVSWLIRILFVLALIPLTSLLWTVVARGLGRFDLAFFSQSMRGIIGEGGGAIHAITGTALITLAAALIAVPVGVGSALWLADYAKPAPAKLLVFLVDVMTGIPSIVAGLFAYAVFSILFGPGVRSGLAGAIALSLLMIPVVVRSSEEMLKLVPDSVREAAIALGAPKHRVVLRVVLPQALPGIIAGIMLGICRIIGETAPLLLVAGFTDSLNRNLLDGRMATLPVYIYSQWQNKGADQAAYDNRAWTAALVLIAMVLIFNLAARFITARLAPPDGNALTFTTHRRRPESQS